MAKLKFSLKPSFVVLCVFVALIGELAVLLCYCISVLLHEVTHFLVARKYRYNCTHITLSAFGAVLYGDFEEAVGRQQILIAVSAPLLNLLICGMTVVAWYIYPQLYVYTLDFALANLLLGITNLLPCYPLDGGKVLIGILSRKHTYTSSLAIVKGITVFFAITLFCTFILAFIVSINLFSLGLFAVFLYGCSINTMTNAMYTKLQFNLLSKSRVARGVPKHTLVISHNSTLLMLLSRMENNTLYTIEVVDDTLHKITVIDYEQLDKLYYKYPIDCTLKQIITEEGSTNHPLCTPFSC